MDRNQRSKDYGQNRSANRHQQDEDQYRGSYRLDNDRGREYERLDHQNFNDRDSSRDYRSGNYQGSHEDRRRERDHELPRDYGRDPHRRGERFDNLGAHEDNNGLEHSARNFGNMGSYGGAQGWGSSRNGSHQNSSGGNQWASGHGRGEEQHVNRQVYGAYRDHNSFAPGEREQYDGTGRYGTQGADNTRGWEPSGRSGSRDSARTSANHNARRDDDSRYEIYDDAQSHYNRGEYERGRQLGQLNSGHDRRTRAENSSQFGYNQARRDHFDQQGEGARSERYGNGENNGNMAGSLSWGYDRDFRAEEGRERRYDPMSGHVRSQGSQPGNREDFNW
ncbi:hypothetical protein ACD591_18345 [Rufibacter glacialis]|uniref:Uncharacterized protein n=1 Tax=Rufibacter glacialis TaxID=1259555 RepID=A0A5M8Q661_9BACT|nr:hypothetical protein [Rufibacter glacialis]KAA6430803.1 hypothetical protein FOE74_20265 [Rufibacter glacialis]GGK86839.1 hypothetical protein GCM10011405_38280 [Rufibacter glacialis]